MEIKVNDNDDVYSLTIRAKGDLNALPEIIPQVSSLSGLSNDIVIEVDEEEEVPSFVTETQRAFPKPPLVFKGLADQTIYDVAIFSRGALEGLADIINQVEDLNNTIFGKEFTLEESEDPRRLRIIERGLQFATGGIEIGGTVISRWILATNFWRDEGKWIDSETWND